MELLENANHAPTHRLTEPWRFKVITGEKLGALGDLLAELYQAKTTAETFSERKYNKTKQKPRQSSHILAICMQRDPEERVPEWEEIAATAMAVQNIWLSAAAHQIGAYWSSPATIAHDKCRAFLNLNEGQRCLGFLYLGYHDMPASPAKREPIAQKIEWL
jgi:nitroreductase